MIIQMDERMALARNSLFQVISVNSQTGERMWSKRLGWRDYLIGQTDQYVVLNNADNEVYLLDTKQGKKSFPKRI